MRKRTLSRKIFDVCNVIFLSLLVVTMVLPYVNILAKAFNDAEDTKMGGIVFWPRKPTLYNFQTVMGSDGFMRAVFVSVARCLSGAGLALVVQFMAAYTFTHKDLIGRTGILVYYMIPGYVGGGIITQYILFSNLGLFNNFMLYILPGCFNMFEMVIIRTFINGLPKGLTEAAKLDGASDMGILLRIVIPLCKPIMATTLLWSVIAHWNDWSTTFYFFTDERLYTLSYLLMKVLKEAAAIQEMIKSALMNGIILEIKSVTTEALQAAQVIITTAPIVFSYPFLQKYFIKGAVIGAIKD
ncbi:MAG: carbohydrate ABC transporter permease [Oscillospiraceae bacterium]|nr:carbohydrate ABC transporter permease [Oscillospiraceae bacterium]